MENLENDETRPLEGGEMEEQPLRLSERLMRQWHSSVPLGRGLMMALLCMAALFVLTTGHNFWQWFGYVNEEFYLLEDRNPSIFWGFSTSFFVYCLLGLSAWEGWKAWSLLKHAADDDNALLEGTERLAKMFKWLAIWGVASVGFNLLDFFIMI